ncbi:ATP-dependent protease [Leptospira langatensis]|uniref:endopeptidase La n=1 Tax=Leptospira langatensis TaxID=2484983 RepID=A0A5F1ZSQ8_9LEPT|nr:S16 family serine protease [Leptospira langatensis]TGK01993.1 ATP-dependent protease [Leptospira langatensis]TGL39547.1 ATP-dependent protease [Leptospira langatensis]
MLRKVLPSQTEIRFKAAKPIRLNGLPDFLVFHKEEVRTFRQALENPKLFRHILITGPEIESNLLRFGQYLEEIVKDQPVVAEPNPTLLSLAGFPLKDMYRAGRIAEANGGLLLLPIKPFVEDPDMYYFLKGVLLTGKIDFLSLPEDSDSAINRFHPSIDSVFRLILVGEEAEVDSISEIDADFYGSFDFKIHMPYEISLDRSSLPIFSGLVKSWEKPGYPPLDQAALDSLLELALRWNDSQNRLSLHLSELRSFVREILALNNKGKRAVGRSEIEAGPSLIQKRTAIHKRKYVENIKEGLISVQLKGKKTGRINGLSVILLQSSLLDFGQVNQVSARVSLGSGNLINIEREVNLSGNLHDKGVFILQSYIKGMFSHIQSFGLDASILFEQNSSPIDGDSASCAELLALLSALSGLEIPCNIAVTGALSQYGDILPVGSVSTKIQAWYDVTRLAGSAQEKYRIFIPKDNVRDLNLPREIRDLMKKGKFQILSCSHVEDLIPEIFGIQAGKMSKSGKYPSGSLFRIIEERIDKKRDEEEN